MKQFKAWLSAQYEDLFWHKEAFQHSLSRASSDAEREDATKVYAQKNKEMSEAIQAKKQGFIQEMGADKHAHSAWEKLDAETYALERMKYAYQKD